MSKYINFWRLSIKYLKDNLIVLSMEVINKPKVYYTQKSLQFFLKDKRKIASAIIIMFLPFISNIWRIIPKDIPFPYYNSLYIFIWTFSTYFIFLILTIAWYLSVPKKDYALQYITLSAVAFGVFLIFETLPFIGATPLWLDLIASSVIFYFIYLAINYIKNNYLSKPSDYKVLHDGLVYDIHHQRFLGSINRIAGLLEVADMKEPYKQLCEQEIEEIKESIAYIAAKYEELT